MFALFGLCLHHNPMHHVCFAYFEFSFSFFIIPIYKGVLRLMAYRPLVFKVGSPGGISNLENRKILINNEILLNDEATIRLHLIYNNYGMLKCNLLWPAEHRKNDIWLFKWQKRGLDQNWMLFRGLSLEVSVTYPWCSLFSMIKQPMTDFLITTLFHIHTIPGLGMCQSVYVLNHPHTLWSHLLKFTGNWYKCIISYMCCLSNVLHSWWFLIYHLHLVVTGLSLSAINTTVEIESGSHLVAWVKKKVLKNRSKLWHFVRFC